MIAGFSAAVCECGASSVCSFCEGCGLGFPEGISTTGFGSTRGCSISRGFFAPFFAPAPFLSTLRSLWLFLAPFCAGSVVRLRFDGRDSVTSLRDEEGGAGALGCCPRVLDLALGEEFLFLFDDGLSSGTFCESWGSVTGGLRLRGWANAGGSWLLFSVAVVATCQLSQSSRCAGSDFCTTYQCFRGVHWARY